MPKHIDDTLIVAMLQRAGRPMSTTEITSRLGGSRNKVADHMARLGAKGRVNLERTSARTYRGNSVRFNFWRAA